MRDQTKRDHLAEADHALTEVLLNLSAAEYVPVAQFNSIAHSLAAIAEGLKTAGDPISARPPELSKCDTCGYVVSNADGRWVGAICHRRADGRTKFPCGGTYRRVKP